MPKNLVRLRQLAFERQNGKCYYCGVTMCSGSSPGPARLRCTAEHLVSRSAGGRNSLDNIVAACAHCNQTRHKRKRPPPPSVFRNQVVRRVERLSWHPEWVYRGGYLLQTSSQR